MTALDVARAYLARGWRVIPVPFKQKAPVLKGWPALELADAELPEYFNGQPSNIGVLLGVPSGGLVDIDLDVREASDLADVFLSPTGCEFGRPSKPRSHRLYIAAPLVPTAKFRDVEKAADTDKTAMIVELRSTDAQTVFPGSTHETDEPITFAADGAPARVDGDGLLRAVRRLAVAAMLARHWPEKGSRHDTVLAAATVLLRVGLDAADVATILTAVARWADPSADLRTVQSDVAGTADKLARNEKVSGGPQLGELLRGDGGAVVKRLRSWFGLHQSAEPRWQAPADRPQIDTGNLGLAEMADAAWAAIERANDPARIYRYGTALAWLAQDPAGRPQIEMMGHDHVRHHLAQVATFIRWTQARPGRAAEPKPAFPPVPLAADLLAVPRPTLPRLQRLVRGPVFTADGRLLAEPGYDPASGLYFAPPVGLTLPAIAEAPSAQAVGEALGLILELFTDFPFLTAADRAHAIALLLTAFLRELIPGNVPLFVVSKPAPRTGAGLLVKVVSLIQAGTPVPATTVSRDEEEMRKRLTAFLLPSPPMILLDNLHGRLDSPALAAILTTWPTWHDRILGKTLDVHVPVSATFVVTGNNVILSSEITGRSVLIRLDPKIEDPSQRTDFRHARLEAWTLENRGRLLWAALTLGQAWIAAGRPSADVVFGGFDEWAGVVGGVLQVASVPGFLDNRATLFEKADEERAPVRAFLQEWWQSHGDAPVLVKDLFALARQHPLPIAAKSEHGMLVRLGQLLRTLEDQVYTLEGCRIVVGRAGEDPHGAILWRLLQAEPAGAPQSVAARSGPEEFVL